jgi:hypothetical protein
LKECNVFGVSSDEYLAYALKNREEWEARGQEMIDTVFLDVDLEEGNVSTDEGI